MGTCRKRDGRGKCKDCCERSAIGEWYCKGCQTRKPKIEFSQWIMINGDKINQTARCDSCKDKHEANQERMRQATKAMVMPSK